MKKLALLICLIMPGIAGSAQEQFNLTVIAAPQISWLKSSSPQVAGGESYLGYGYGLEGELFLGRERFALASGVTLSQAGGTLTYGPAITVGGKSLPAGTSVEYFLKNLEVPLALKIRTNDLNRFRLFGQLGITNWLNVGTQLSTNNSLDPFRKANISKEINFYSLGYQVGGGVEYDLGHGFALTGGFIFSCGLTDGTRNTTFDDKMSLRVVRIRTGIVF